MLFDRSFVKSEGGLDSVTILNVDVQGDKALVVYQTKTKQGKEQIITAKADTFNLASEALEKYRQILLKRYNRLEKLLESGS